MKGFLMLEGRMSGLYLIKRKQKGLKTLGR